MKCYSLKPFANLVAQWFGCMRSKTTSYTCTCGIGIAVSIRARRIVGQALRYFCTACNRIAEQTCRDQNDTKISIGLTVLGDQKGTVAHRRVRHCENCDAEDFTTLELKERDFNELLDQIKSAKAQAAAARQELGSLKRAVLSAVELSTKASSQSIHSHLKSDSLARIQLKSWLRH